MYNNKLIRDKVPSIIKKSGKSCKCEIMQEEQYMTALVSAMHDELAEFVKQFDAMNDEQAIKELADLQELILALVASLGVTEESFDRIRQAKRSLYGGFDDKILLVEVSG